MRAIALVVNGKAGSGNCDEVVACMRQRYGEFALFELGVTGERGLDGLQNDPDIEVVAVCGGDGSVSAAASALAERELPIAVIPGGTANLLAHELELPFEPRRACELLASGRSTRVDTLDLPDRRCLCRIALGDFARSGQRSEPDAKQRAGSLAYLLNGLPEITTPSLRSFNVEVDGTSHTVEASSLVLTNIARVGLGNMRWGSEVSAHDGVVELIALRPSSLVGSATLTASSIWDDPLASSYTEHWSAHDHVVFHDLEHVPVVADGEPLERAQLRVDATAGGVVVLTP